jgi:uncharacterized integral membrane protein
VKYLMWLLNAAIFFVLFAFALNNQAPVTLHLFFGASWQAPLVLVLLCVLLVGARTTTANNPCRAAAAFAVRAGRCGQRRQSTGCAWILI